VNDSNKLLPSLKEVIEQHGLLAKKSLGQNFLLNMDITRRIAKSAGNFDGTTVLEIGPGPGGLTRALLECGAQVVAIERDDRCIKILHEVQKAYPLQLKIIEGDALEISPQSIIPEGNIKIVANLPYNIGTPLLIKWLFNLDRISSMTLMFQKEVAMRLMARPRSKAYGRLSVLGQWLCDITKVFDLPPRVFVPAPKVVSSVVQFKPRNITDKEKEMFSCMEKVTQHAFGQRRKMIRSSLNALFADTALTELGLNPTARAEELTVQDFLRLAQYLFSQQPIISST
jgi:16S rRNA (adenine1518-N6/adenine1519-N6)-dimethyltransferase